MEIADKAKSVTNAKMPSSELNDQVLNKRLFLKIQLRLLAYSNTIQDPEWFNGIIVQEASFNEIYDLLRIINQEVRKNLKNRNFNLFNSL